MQPSSLQSKVKAKMFRFKLVRSILRGVKNSFYYRASAAYALIVATVYNAHIMSGGNSTDRLIVIGFACYVLVYLLLKRWSIAAYESGAMPLEEEEPEPGSLRELFDQNEDLWVSCGLLIGLAGLAVIGYICGWQSTLNIS